MIEKYKTDEFENLKDKKQLMLVEDFHLKRIAFLIFNNKVLFLRNSTKSHLQWAKELNISEEEFNLITRGYSIDDKIVFYKGNFDSDQQVESDAKKFSNEIAKFCNLSCAEVYCGLIVGKPGEIYKPKKKLFEIECLEMKKDQ